MAGTATGKLDFAEYGTYSVSAWVLADTVKVTGDNGQRQYIVQKGVAQYTLQLNHSGFWDFSEGQSTSLWSYTVSPCFGSPVDAGDGRPCRNKHVLVCEWGMRRHCYQDGGGPAEEHRRRLDDRHHVGRLQPSVLPGPWMRFAFQASWPVLIG